MPRRLLSKIHSDFSANSQVWANYRTEIISLFGEFNSGAREDFNDHLLREFNRKISNLGLSSELYFSPFDGGFRYISGELGDAIPANALGLGGEPLTLDGEYLTIGT